VSVELHLATPAELDATTLYRVLQLRVEVFVVEQQCPYPELDGRDLEPGTRWLWATEAPEAAKAEAAERAQPAESTEAADSAGTVLATLRILREPSGTARIGRVATARRARGAGLAADLVRYALRVLDEDPTEIVLDAQTPLAGWYRRFGFEPAGAQFVEDGISHLPMRRPPVAEGSGRPAGRTAR